AFRDRSEIENRTSSTLPGVQQVQLVVEHRGRVPALLRIARDESDVDGSARPWDADRAHDFPALEVPDTNAASKVDATGHCVKRRRRAYKITCHHQIQFVPHGNTVGVEAIQRRNLREFL